MFEAFEENGYWWVPGSEDKVAGSLSYSPEEGVRLSLVGTLRGFRDAFVGSKEPVILGHLVDGSPVTLLECLNAGGSFHFPGYATSEYWATWAFVGWHFNARNGLLFDAASLLFHNAEECIGLSGFTEEPRWGREENGVGYSLQYRYPPTIEFAVGEFTGKLTWTLRLEGVGRKKEKACREEAWVELNSRKPVPYLEFLDGPAKLVKSLMELTAEAYRPIKRVCFRSAVCCEKLGGDEHRVPIWCLWRQPMRCTPTEPKRPRQMMFTLASVRERLNGILAKWAALHTEHASTLDTLGMVTRLVGDLPWQHRFLSLVYAVEGYHRTSRVGLELTPEEHENRLQAIYANTPTCHLKWLRDKLAFSNELSLRHRLLELHGRLLPSGQTLIGDAKAFAHTVCETRNYLVHQTPEMKDKAAEGAGLYLCIQRLELLLKILLLSELGFSDEEVAAISDRLGFARRLKIDEP